MIDAMRFYLGSAILSLLRN
jgi:hypothetical protein